MGDDIEFKHAIGKCLDQHPGVLLRSSTDGKMIEGKYSIAVKRLDPGQRNRLSPARGMRCRRWKKFHATTKATVHCLTFFSQVSSGRVSSRQVFRGRRGASLRLAAPFPTPVFPIVPLEWAALGQRQRR